MRISPKRLVLFLFLLLCGAITFGVMLSINRDVTTIRAPSLANRPAPLTLERLNASPATDPLCLSTLTNTSGVKFRLSRDFVQAEACTVEGALYADRLANLPFSPKGPLTRCEVASPLNQWLEEVVKPAALEFFDTEIVRVGHLGTYNCRTIGGSNRIMSQHSFANAIDIAWFELADGRRLTLEEGWAHEDAAIRTFWKQIHRLSCKYFHVSLGPDYDTAHADHFHFDMGPRRTCR